MVGCRDESLGHCGPSPGCDAAPLGASAIGLSPSTEDVHGASLVEGLLIDIRILGLPQVL